MLDACALSTVACVSIQYCALLPFKRLLPVWAVSTQARSGLHPAQYSVRTLLEPALDAASPLWYSVLQTELPFSSPSPQIKVCQALGGFLFLAPYLKTLKSGS